MALGARRARVRADSLLVGQFERVTREHVPRERNRRADAHANQAMDAQGMVERPVQGLPQT